jgi:hypothetical protein
MRQIHLSASGIQSFKACPTRYKLRYVDRIRREEDTDSLRVGTNWHALHEIYQNVLTEGGDPLAAVIDHLNEVYAVCPSFKTTEEWAVERTILLCSFILYLDYYSEDTLEYVANELPFNLPLATVLQSKEGPNKFWLPKEEVVRVGKIDHIVRRNGVVRPFERKSTVRDIDPNAEYWERLRKDTQVNMYALAFRDILRDPSLAEEADGILDEFQGEVAGNTLYDVWRKPTTKPKMLTQAATAEFIETGEYCGGTFNVLHFESSDSGPETVKVDNDYVFSKPGAKSGIAIRENIDMYGARLMQEMSADPERYFQRREVARTTQEVDRFEEELYRIYQAMRMYEKHECWFENEGACKASYTCEYLDICNGCGSLVAPTIEKLPLGFKRSKKHAEAPASESATEESTTNTGDSNSTSSKASKKGPVDPKVAGPPPSRK